jgi:hypothetical protein
MRKSFAVAIVQERGQKRQAWMPATSAGMTARAYVG